MVLGDTCTCVCCFCAVKIAAQPAHSDEDKPMFVAVEITHWRLKYDVLTTVDREDLADVGAAHFVKTVLHDKTFSAQSSG